MAHDRPTERHILAALLVAATFLVVGCTRDPGLQPVPPPAPASTDPLQPSLPADAPSATPGLELGEPKALVSMPWKLSAISSDRRTITVQFVSGDGWCVKHVGYHLERDGQTLRLGEYSRTNNEPACPARLELGGETVPLPLALDGSVQLVHAPASQEWSRLLE